MNRIARVLAAPVRALSPFVNVLCILVGFVAAQCVDLIDGLFFDWEDGQPSPGSWLWSDLAIGAGLVAFIAASAVFA